MRHFNTRYSIDERFFRYIDCESKAYWIGFLTADGCVYRRDGTSQVTLALAGVDAAHVAKFATAISSNQPVKVTTRKAWGGKLYSQVRLTVCNKQMADDLISHGIIPRKTHVATPWNGPVELLQHYWRGVVDGDGWITNPRAKARHHCWGVGLSGSEGIVRGFIQWVETNLGLHTELRPAGLAFQTSFGGTFGPQKLVHLLYDNATVCLDRKYQLAKELMSIEFPVHKFAPRKDVLDADLIAAYADLRSVKKVAAKFLMDDRSVSRRLKSNGIILRPSRW